MSLADALAEALDKKSEGTITAEHGGAKAHVDVVTSGPVGVRVRGVKIERGRDVPIETAAEELPGQLAGVLPERIHAVEVDPRLGGAILRTKPDEMRGREFVEVEVSGTRKVDIRRWEASDEGRKPKDWAMTRDALGRLVDDLG
ncbi:MAG: hypothetical protein EP330_27355 [Deltaproteobacteria bacterium]|nr:MAG: hypothetical protein EP330_27355 [Deltaproteobacteria bacterium]